MNDNQAKVTGWIRSGMDYNDGIILLVKLTQKQSYAGQFAGREKTMAGKLAYEICKAAQVADVTDWKAFIQKVKDSAKDGNHDAVTDINHEGSTKHQPEINPSKENQENDRQPDPSWTEKEASIPEAETLETKPFSEYPPLIRRMVHEYASLFQERSRLHASMTELPESNAETVMARRKEIFDMVKSLSERLELLYINKKSFDEKGIVPDEKTIYPDPELQEEKKELDNLDATGLKKQKKNLQSSNSKDQAMLDYQSKQHGETKKPMPNGPKRLKIEARMKERNRIIEEIDLLLLKDAAKE